MANISSALNTAFKSIVEDNISALAVHVASELAGSKGKVTEEAVRKAIESFVVPADGAAKAKGKAVFASLSGPVTHKMTDGKVDSDTAEVVMVEDYSPKSTAFVGGTKEYKDVIKAAGAKYNGRLSVGAGWIASKDASKKVVAALKKAGAVLRTTTKAQLNASVDVADAKADSDGDVDDTPVADTKADAKGKAAKAAPAKADAKAEAKPKAAKAPKPKAAPAKAAAKADTKSAAKAADRLSFTANKQKLVATKTEHGNFVIDDDIVVEKRGRSVVAVGVENGEGEVDMLSNDQVELCNAKGVKYDKERVSATVADDDAESEDEDDAESDESEAKDEESDKDESSAESDADDE